MNNNAKTTWILVAHRAGAALYESRGPGGPFPEIEHIEHPRGRLKPGEVNSDRPGRAFDRVGGGRHAMAVEESADQRIEHEFVLQLVERIERGRAEGAFDRFVLVAPPKMLGRLRDALPQPLRPLLAGTLAKDLAHGGGEDVRRHVGEIVLV